MDMIGKVTRMKWLKAPGYTTQKYERKKADGKLKPFVAVLEQTLRTDAHRAKNARRSGKALFAQIQAQGCFPLRSCTILTARSRTSGENLSDFFTAQSSQSVESPQKSGNPVFRRRPEAARARAEN
jgi:hypothetical protein